MYCQKCGKYNSEGKEVCMYCGHHMSCNGSAEEKITEKKSFYQSDAWGQQYKQQHQQQKPQQRPQPYGEEKTGVGIALSIFLGVIGLIIGLLLYSPYSHERETFIKGWIRGFVIIAVIFGVLFFAVSCFACVSSVGKY